MLRQTSPGSLQSPAACDQTSMCCLTDSVQLRAIKSSRRGRRHRTQDTTAGCFGHPSFACQLHACQAGAPNRRSRSPSRFRRPVRELLAVKEGSQVRSALSEEPLGVRDCSVVDGRTKFRQEVVEQKGRFQVADLLAKFLLEVPSERCHRMLAVVIGQNNRGLTAHRRFAKWFGRSA